MRAGRARIGRRVLSLGSSRWSWVAFRARRPVGLALKIGVTKGIFGRGGVLRG